MRKIVNTKVKFALQLFASKSKHFGFTHELKRTIIHILSNILIHPLLDTNMQNLNAALSNNMIFHQIFINTNYSLPIIRKTSQHITNIINYNTSNNSLQR